MAQWAYALPDTLCGRCGVPVSEGVPVALVTAARLPRCSACADQLGLPFDPSALPPLPDPEAARATTMARALRNVQQASTKGRSLMPFHVVQIGDTHGRVDARSDDQYASLDIAIARGLELAAAGTLALWAWPGDLLHAVSEAETRNALFRRAMQMAEVAPIVIVRGNHDLTGELDAFAWLKARWPIYVSQTPELLTIETAVMPRPISHGTGMRPLQASIWTMPYPNKGALVAAGTPPNLVAQVGHAALDGLMMYGAAQLAERPETMRLVLCHGNVVGARSSTGQPQIGAELEFSTDMFERFEPDVFIGLNHIHKHQAVGRGVFAGSLCRLDFGELEPKGIVVADFEPTEHGRMSCVGWRFEPIDVTAMYQIEGELTPEGFTFAVVQGDGAAVSPGTLDLLNLTTVGRDAIASGAIVTAPASWRGCDVRVSYRYKPADLPRLNVALIHAEFAEARTLKIVAIPDRSTDVRAPEVLAAVTMQDKLQAYAVHSGLAWSEELAALAALIETQPVDRWQADTVKAIAEIGAEVTGS